MRKTVCAGVLIAVGILACGDEMTDSAGDALRKAGKAIADAGEALADAGSDASAQEDAGQVGLPKSETVELPCDEIYEKNAVWDYPEVTSEISRIETRGYFATMRTDTNSVLGVDAIACDLEPVGNNVDRVVCGPNHWSCTGQDVPPEAAPCTTITASIGSGFVRVQCGQWRRGTGFLANPIGEAGSRYKRVRITVRR